MKKQNILFLLLFLILNSCEEPISSFDEFELGFYTLDQGQISERLAGNFTIRSDFEYQQLFGQPSNGFNFQDEMIIAVYKGQLPNGGNEYEISSILERKNDVLVTIVFNPCEQCNRSLSSPYHIIGLDRSNKLFNFIEVLEN